MNIKKGDKVIVIAGKDKNKSGKVLRVFRDRDRVIVEGMNVLKKHRKSGKSNEKGQIIEKSMPIHISNVAVADPDGGKPTRVKHKVEKGKKVRVAAKSGKAL